MSVHDMAKICLTYDIYNHKKTYLSIVVYGNIEKNSNYFFMQAEKAVSRTQTYCKVGGKIFGNAKLKPS